MAKCKDGSFYATVQVDIEGSETVLYNGAKQEGMQAAFTRNVELQTQYTNQGKQFSSWNYDQAKDVLVNRIEMRRYLPGKTGSIDRMGKGLKGEYEVLECKHYISTSEEATPKPPFEKYDIVCPNRLFFPNAKWQYASVIAYYYDPKIEGGWVVDIQQMNRDENGKLVPTRIKEYMRAGWELQLYQKAPKLALVHSSSTPLRSPKKPRLSRVVTASYDTLDDLDFVK